ncbi:MAG: deoxyribodipyrimidine photo-lyase [Bacteroidales bacterium]
MTRPRSFEVNPKRVQLLNDKKYNGGTVVYWMSRDQRVNDNWALLYATELSLKYHSPLMVVFTLTGNYQGAGLRHYDFMIRGLMEVERKLADKNIPFHLIEGNPPESLYIFLRENKTGALVSDFDPLRIKKRWKKELTEKIDIPLYEVDAHNVVPCIIASHKAEFAAYTLRPKIRKHIDEFMEEYPEIPAFEKNNIMLPGGGTAETTGTNGTDWTRIRETLCKKTGDGVKPVDWLMPGEAAALDMFNTFINEKLLRYEAKRNDPNAHAVSNISPYLHFGQISAQRMAMEVIKKFPEDPNASAFLEELIVRKELSDNFCHFNPNYDSYDGFPEWAKKTLNEHRKDEREYLYDQNQFEAARTHDPLWNAAQQEMVNKGKMHGYMRMYWAKKILEWSPSPEDALHVAVFLNDKYQLDGRDPNGYAGCAWSIGGVHDRAWGERPVFGKIRYMNYNGCKRKFDTGLFIKKYPGP